jgi:ComF family protein
MITQLKFSRRLSATHGLGALFASKMEDYGYTKNNLPEVILPMPLHEKRLRKRGYNQAYELSYGLLKYKGNTALKALPMQINDRLCWRIKSTAAQSGLGKSARQENMAGAFAIAPEIAHYKHVAIFDDVVTTGATVNALSLALKEAGVEQVDVWCICRA